MFDAPRRKLSSQLHPGIDFTSTVGPTPDRDDFDLTTYQETLRVSHIPAYPSVKPFSFPGSSHQTSAADSSGSSPAAAAPSPSRQVLGPTPWRSFEKDPNRPLDDTEEVQQDAHLHAVITHAMSKLNMKDVTWRFHGKASGAHLLSAFNDFKYAKTGQSMLEGINNNKRTEYWLVPEWELVIAQECVQPIDYSVWPDDDLARALIEVYFRNVNFHLPLLNRPLFLRQYDAGLYRNNHEFAKVCLMVFANGSRFVDDDRVYWPRDLALTEEGKERLRTDKDGTLKYSAGWLYLRSHLKMGRSMMQTPNLFDFQTEVLICAFLQGSAVPHLTWLISGVGMRAAQELGIHVRSTLIHANPVERALYNRAFWCLYHIDRINCAAIGRSVALQDTDFDADYPIAVDDEFWETGDPAQDFKQPQGGTGVPQVTAFIQLLKLDHLIGAALRTIYAVNKLPEHRSDPASRRAVVVELDSALNAWADAVPDGLRWDPTRADQQLFEQSAVLYSQYYYCQILIHRAFIPTPRQPDFVGLPSLAICSNAARSICNILDAVLRRGRQSGALPGRAMNVHFMLPAWIAAIVLLISMYATKQQKTERERALSDVRRCIAALKEIEMTWRQAGKLTDMLGELARDGDAIPDDEGVTQGRKRPSDGGSSYATPQTGSHGDRTGASTPLEIHPSQEYGLEWAPIPNGSDPGPMTGGQDRPKTTPYISGLKMFATQIPSLPAQPPAPDSFDSGQLNTDFWGDIYGSLGAVTNLEVPAQNLEGGDVWAQLFAGYM